MVDNILYATYNTNYISKNANRNNKTDTKGQVKL